MALPPLVAFVKPVLTAVEMAAAILLSAHRLPRRDHFAGRAGALAALVLCVILVLTSLYPGPPGKPNEEVPYLALFALFSVVLALSVPLTMWLYRTSAWTALFCCTAGYTMQNLASGLEGLVTFALQETRLLPDELTSGPLFTLLIMTLTSATVYTACYLVFVRRVEGERLTELGDHRMLGNICIVILAVMGFDLVVKYVELADVPYAIGVLLHCVHALTCVLVLYIEYEVLYNQKLRLDSAVLQRMLDDARRHYEISRENMEAINIKCHDIRHQIRHIGEAQGRIDDAFLTSLEHAVDVYDSRVSTGNDALDTILTEKGLICSNRGIELTCLVDGKALGFMPPSALYSLFGNALDNAIEAVDAVEEPERRVISVNVRSVGRMALAHVENYTAAIPSFDDEGLPVTSKGDRRNHGFGTRSMREIVHEYGGEMSCRARGDVFYLDIMLPLPTAR